MVEGNTKTAFAITAFSLLGEAALHLSGYHNIPLSIVLGIIAMFALTYAIWHGISDWRQKHGKTRLTVEPSYVIALGFLITVGGLVAIAGGYLWERSLTASAHNLSEAGRTTKLDIWTGVNNDCIPRFVNIHKGLDGTLNNWPLMVKTSRGAFLSSLSDAANGLEVASSCADKFINEYPSYKDIFATLSNPYSGTTEKAIKDFLELSMASRRHCRGIMTWNFAPMPEN